MRRLTGIVLALLISATMTILLVLAVQAQTLASPPPPTPTLLAGAEFTLPISDRADEEWQTFTGVGHTLRCPPTWQVQPYQAQGGVRDGAAFQFLWTDQQVTVAQIESLEIANATDGAAVMETELNYWQQKEQHGYHVETVTVQGHPGWWIPCYPTARGDGAGRDTVGQLGRTGLSLSVDLSACRMWGRRAAIATNAVYTPSCCRGLETSARATACAARQYHARESSNGSQFIPGRNLQPKCSLHLRQYVLVYDNK